MKKTTTPVAADPQPDAYTGQGGSYVLDPATGQRQLVHRTAASADSPADAQDTVTPPAGTPATDQPQE